MMDRAQQRQQFASQQTQSALNNAMSQYRDWTAKNPQQQPVAMPRNPMAMPKAQAGGANTAFTAAFNSIAPQTDQSRQFRSIDTFYGIPNNVTQRYRTTAAQSFGGEGQGNLAYMPKDRRPAPFSASYRDFDGSVRDTPVTDTRDALIQRINETAQPYYANSGVRETTMGQQQFDMPSLMRGARDMAKGGYKNPLLQGLFG